MRRNIKTVAVLGSGIMGSRIACHFANAGVKVLLLGIAPSSTEEADIATGGRLDDQNARNRIVDNDLRSTLKATPASLYDATSVSLIITGNLVDDLHKVSECDWILEAVIEDLEVKKEVFEKVDLLRRTGSLVTSNTSGIPIHLMAEGRSEDFRRNFCGTHFFNPPRYLRLLELIPGPDTSSEVLDFLYDYSDRFLGKTVVSCKDTPAFVANRIGVFSIMSVFHIVEEMGLTVDAVDKLTGPVLGRPKSATFRTCDVVGLDTLVKVAADVHARCEKDEARDTFQLPDYVRAMIDQKRFGDKTGQGFYRKQKSADGHKVILSLDLATLEYGPKEKSVFPVLDQVKPIDDLRQRIPILFSASDKAGDFYRESFFRLFSYVSHRWPEVADHLDTIDDAICAGFGWEIGPFATWDLLGVREVADAMDKAGHKVASWVTEMISAGREGFFRFSQGRKWQYDPATGKEIPCGSIGSLVLLDAHREKTVWKNSGCNLLDIGDGVLCLEFRTKMNTIGGEVVAGVNKSIEIAEQNFEGLIIANEGLNFSAGANLAMVFMMATEQEFDEIDFAVRAFQNMNMRVRYSTVPVVVAPHGLTLGGGCEMSLHADCVIAAAETYTGMVEFGVGLIPGGGGSKEFTLRASDLYSDGIIDEQILREFYLTIAMAKVSTSASEAFKLKLFRKGVDEVVMNPSRRIKRAKEQVQTLVAKGYRRPVDRNDIKVLGKNALGMFTAGANSMLAGGFISDHDHLISRKLAWIMCGGDLSSPALVSEKYLLDLEREAFLSLCGERKTLERIQSILVSGKPLRN